VGIIFRERDNKKIILDTDFWNDIILLSVNHDHVYVLRDIKPPSGANNPQGGKKMGEKEKKATVAVTLEPELKAALETLAKACDRTIAAQVRALIRSACTPQTVGPA
jgi:hypothetical protein